MKFLRTVLILALFLCGIAFSGCGGANENANQPSAGNSGTNVDNANSAKTNVEELQLLVNVPFEAEDVVWKENPKLRQVIAVLRFSPEDSNKLVAEAAVRQAPQEVKLSSETWFPAELIAQSEMTGDDMLNGLAYAADSFYQEPYTSGRVVRIEGTDYFILELSAK